MTDGSEYQNSMSQAGVNGTTMECFLIFLITQKMTRIGWMAFNSAIAHVRRNASINEPKLIYTVSKHKS